MMSFQVKDLEPFRSGFLGDLLLPESGGYEEARKLWNAMIDRRPAMIARCATRSDVAHAVHFARKRGLPLAVRGGGHNIAGSAMCDDGLVIDLSRLKAAEVDAERRRVTIEGGATLADLDAATQIHGLATPTGINSTTGLGGLTLGGGFGWLSRKYGLTIDNLESAEVVLASGEVVRAAVDEHPDLFWALRGGSGNFGVVTRFEFRLHPVGPEVLSGLIVYPATQGKKVMRRYREFVHDAPDDLSVWMVLRQAPPLPFLPPDFHGKNMVALAFLYAGDPKEGAAIIEPLRRFGTPAGENVGIQPYAAWQQAFDPLLGAGARNYWKSHNLSALEDGLIEAVIHSVETLPSPQCEIFIASLGGATRRSLPEATAYPHRNVNFVVNVHGRWDYVDDDERGVAWARRFFESSAPFSLDGVYVNFLTDDEPDAARAAYGVNYDRLVRVKRTYDPDNLFRFNHNVAPTRG